MKIQKHIIGVCQDFKANCFFLLLFFKGHHIHQKCTLLFHSAGFFFFILQAPKQNKKAIKGSLHRVCLSHSQSSVQFIHSSAHSCQLQYEGIKRLLNGGYALISGTDKKGTRPPLWPASQPTTVTSLYVMPAVSVLQILMLIHSTVAFNLSYVHAPVTLYRI